MNELEIFSAALEIQDEAERSEYLDEACQDNLDLRRRIEVLLTNAAVDDSLLDTPILEGVDLTSPLDSIVAQPGDQIGPYKLLQKIGEGGMGVVFMAEQREPIHRRVALKIIKPGMDTREVIARFEAERQAMAMMDHPNIARAIDVGTTSERRPYFVMELVKGMAITKYCDDHRLTPRQRLELMIPICRAVQHAHQKGIIHRDIKPSNVLVADYDNQAIPKIIDFGVAKALDRQLTNKTMFTQLGQLVGTLEYMSPEQAKVNQLDVDTRTDIYSLGVLLYELLAGSTPFEKQRLHEAAWDEIMRIIRDEEPPRPSTRLSSSDTLPSIAARRQTEPAKLSKLVRGDLDWIAMKALDKERSRRYETAASLAQDIQRYLDDEPVQACPPSIRYRSWKFARRHRTAILMATTLLLLIVSVSVGMGIFGWWAIVAKRQMAEQVKETAEARKLAEGNLTQALDAVNRLLSRMGERELRNVPMMTKVRKQVLEDAQEVLQKLSASNTSRLSVRARLIAARARIAVIYEELGRIKRAEKAYRNCIEEWNELLGSGNGLSSWCIVSLAKSHQRLGSLQQSKSRYTQSLHAYQAAQDALAKLTPQQLLKHRVLNAELQADIASVYYDMSKLGDAKRRFLAALKAYDALEDGAQKAAVEAGQIPCLQALGFIHMKQGEPDLGIRSWQQAATLARRRVARDPWARSPRVQLSSVLNSLSVQGLMTGKFEDAEKAVSEAIENQRGVVRDYPHIAKSRALLADYYMNYYILLKKQGKHQPCAMVAKQMVRERRLVARVFPQRDERREDVTAVEIAPGHWVSSGTPAAVDALAWSLSNLADVLIHLGELAAADEAYAESRKLAPKMVGAPHNFAWNNLIATNPAHRRPARALALATETARLAPKHGSPVYLMGLAHYRLGNHEKALAHLKKAAKMGYQSTSFPFVMAMVYHSVGQTKEAREALEKGNRELKKPRQDYAAMLLQREARSLVLSE